MRRLITLAVLCTLSIMIAGCSQSLDKAIIGKYGMEVDTSGADKMIAEMAKAFKDTSLEIKEGGKAEMSVMGQKMPGTWKLDGNKLTVTPDKGGDAAKLIVEDGGKTLKPDPADSKNTPKGVKISFKKQ